MNTATPRFVTIHILNALPLHNMNRDQNGLPKSEMDGGVQRARISSQALKRAARVAFRDAGHGTAIRTRHAVAETLSIAKKIAAERNIAFDEKKADKSINKVISSLTKKPSESKDQADSAPAGEEGSDNVIFVAIDELTALAEAVVDSQLGKSEEPTATDSVVADATSPALEIAAFGRMFANAAGKGTHAAVAVSHAHTTHPMQLTADYFTAVEDTIQDHDGAAHIGVAYYTSGVYYRTFTIDIDQLARSWSSMHTEGGREVFASLIKCLIVSLPSGRSSNSNPYTQPIVVLAETQNTRTAYAFETPVEPGSDGGYSDNSIRALAAQRELAVTFNPESFGPAVAHVNNGTTLVGAELVTTLDEIVAFTTSQVYGA